jgi:hypothetical protein
MPTAPRTPETKAIGARPLRADPRAGLSREEFAKLLPTAAKQISRMEQGYRVSNVRLAKVDRFTTEWEVYAVIGAFLAACAFSVYVLWDADRHGVWRPPFY